MKFEIKIPEDAKWLAQDADGSWWAYTAEPEYDEETKQWDPNLRHACPSNSITPLAMGPKPADASQELYKIIWR